MVCSSRLSSGEQAYTSRQQTSKVVQVASRTKLEVCVDPDFMDTHLLVKLNVDQRSSSIFALMMLFLHRKIRVFLNRKI
jgi:hypothetical protein